MKNNSSSDHIKSTILGWKFVTIVGILTGIFFTGLYSAMTYEPDYMVEKRQKVAAQQEVDTSAPQTVEDISNTKKDP